MAQFHVYADVAGRRSEPAVRRIGLEDVGAALREGYDDFAAYPTHAAFLVVLYPIIGFCLAALFSGVSAFPLLYPLMSGFALLGPIAAIVMYEISRRREAGMTAATGDLLGVLRSPSLPSILALGALLLVIFVVWIAVAEAIFQATMGSHPQDSTLGFIRDVLTTRDGWALIVVGNLVGLAFAAIVLAISAISFPLMLDRDVGAASAVQTSWRAVRDNPVPFAVWGVIAALAIIVGFACLFIGLAVTLPIMGHATWHLYRRVVVPEQDRNPVGAH